MRYIDLDRLVGTPGVQELINTAEAARAAIRTAPDSRARAALMQAHRKDWVAFRPFFVLEFGGKCWYTECKNPGTDDDVDHYRPKGQVAEDPRHGGYWWEALNWRNLRLSCHRANRLRSNPETRKTHGKGDHFPLLREEDRCRTPDDDIARERPTLLDPTDPSDPPLVTFDPDGRVALSPYYKDDPDASRRLEDSRLYLHLDWPGFREERQALFATIFTKVLDGDQYFSRLNSEASAKEGLKRVARDLIRLAAERQPYSRAAQAFILFFRDRAWIRMAVQPYIPDLPGK